MIDHFLIIGFGGPENLQEVAPFVQAVAQGRNIPEQRLVSVMGNYELIGGKSPYNEEVFRFVVALKEGLEKVGCRLPVFVGMRYWRPHLAETVKQLYDAGFRKGRAVILSPFRSPNSCKQYKEKLEEVISTQALEGLSYDFAQGWAEKPQFIGMHAAIILEALKKQPDAYVLFAAHSIPVASDQACGLCHYSRDIFQACEKIAAASGISKWQVAYQSRSGNPREPWLGPDILAVTEELARAGEKALMVDPIGFFCDNAEIRYDLDVCTANLAKSYGMTYQRLGAFSSNPLAAQLIRSQLYSDPAN